MNWNKRIKMLTEAHKRRVQEIAFLRESILIHVLLLSDNVDNFHNYSSTGIWMSIHGAYSGFFESVSFLNRAVEEKEDIEWELDLLKASGWTGES